MAESLVGLDYYGRAHSFLRQTPRWQPRDVARRTGRSTWHGCLSSLTSTLATGKRVPLPRVGRLCAAGSQVFSGVR